MPDTQGVGNDHEQHAQMLEQRFGIDPGKLADKAIEKELR